MFTIHQSTDWLSVDPLLRGKNSQPGKKLLKNHSLLELDPADFFHCPEGSITCSECIGIKYLCIKVYLELKMNELDAWTLLNLPSGRPGIIWESSSKREGFLIHSFLGFRHTSFRGLNCRLKSINYRYTNGLGSKNTIVMRYKNFWTHKHYCKPD